MSYVKLTLVTGDRVEVDAADIEDILERITAANDWVRFTNREGRAVVVHPKHVVAVEEAGGKAG